MISSFQVTYNIRLRYFKNHAVYVCSQKNGILEVAATASSSSILLPVTTIILETESCRLEPHRSPCVVCLSKNINRSLVLVQPRKNRPFNTERLLMGRKESNQTNKTTIIIQLPLCWEKELIF